MDGMAQHTPRGGLKALVALGALGIFLFALLASPASDDRQTTRGLEGGIAWADDGDTVTLDIGDEEVEIEDFLRAVAKHTKTPLVWNPQDKNIRGKKIIGNVNLRAPKGELFALARALLTVYELVMIPVGPGDYKVQLVMDARNLGAILKLKPEYVKLTDEKLGIYESADGKFITTTIRVENMTDLRNARNALTRIVTGSNIGNVTEVPAAKAFVVTDFAPNVVAIYRLLREMDVKPSGREKVTRVSTPFGPVTVFSSPASSVDSVGE